MISVLRDEYVNAWLLARDLDEIAERSEDAAVAELCGLIEENYDYPVDSVLVSPELELLGHLNVEDPGAMEPGVYLSFLRRGLANARGEAFVEEAPPDSEPAIPVKPPVVVRPSAPTATVLDVFERRGFGQPSMAFYTIDASAFPAGGTLEISVRVGSARATGKFELCAAAKDQPGYVAPVKSLERVGTDETATMTYDFEPGQFLALTAMPAGDSAEGAMNAFLATITVRER